MTTELPIFAPHTLREQVTNLKGSAVLGSGQWSLLMRPSQRRQGALAVTTDWPGALAIYRGSQPTAGQASEVRGPSCTAYSLRSGCPHPGAWAGGPTRYYISIFYK